MLPINTQSLYIYIHTHTSTHTVVSKKKNVKSLKLGECCTHFIVAFVQFQFYVLKK